MGGGLHAYPPPNTTTGTPTTPAIMFSGAWSTLFHPHYRVIENGGGHPPSSTATRGTEAQPAPGPSRHGQDLAGVDLSWHASRSAGIRTPYRRIAEPAWTMSCRRLAKPVLLRLS